MRAPYTTSALVLLAFTWVANQFPLWGAGNNAAVANDWGVTYLLGAAPLVVAGLVLLWRGKGDLGTGALVLGLGMYGDAFMMTIITDSSVGGDTMYAAVQALMAFAAIALLILLQRPHLKAPEGARG